MNVAICRMNMSLLEIQLHGKTNGPNKARSKKSLLQGWELCIGGYSNKFWNGKYFWFANINQIILINKILFIKMIAHAWLLFRYFTALTCWHYAVTAWINVNCISSTIIINCLSSVLMPSWVLIDTKMFV